MTPGGAEASSSPAPPAGQYDQSCTPAVVIEVLDRILVAPCSTRIRGIPTELPLGRGEGLDLDSVAQLDLILPVRKSSLHRHLGTIGPDRHAQRCEGLGIALGCD